MDASIRVKALLLIRASKPVDKLRSVLAGVSAATLNYMPPESSVSSGDTLLHEVVSCSYDAEMKDFSPELGAEYINLLIELGADVTLTFDGQTPADMDVGKKYPMLLPK